VAEGELGEVDRQRKASARTYTANEKLGFYQGLLWIAKERGYRTGWAAHKYREKFGAWPAVKYAVPKPPDDALRSWVRSRQIADARAMEKSA
jgi:hypothetical protein